MIYHISYTLESVLARLKGLRRGDMAETRIFSSTAATHNRFDSFQNLATARRHAPLAGREYGKYKPICDQRRPHERMINKPLFSPDPVTLPL